MNRKTICYGLAGGSGLLIDSYWLLLVSRACLGISPAGIFAGINVLILNMYNGIERDRVMGWRGSAQSFGGVIWPLIGGTLGGFQRRISGRRRGWCCLVFNTFIRIEEGH